jgi:hypothetical protein
MEMFSRQPFFGFGWGADFSYSIVTQMLANVGLVGGAAFLVAAGATLVASRNARRGSDAATSHLAIYAEAAENAFIVYLAESVVSGFKFVVADFWCLWAFAIAIPTCLVSVRDDMNSSMASIGGWRSKVLPSDT